MRLSNGETLLRWPLAQHIITQGWNGGAHNGIDLRCTWGGTTAQPVYAAEGGTVDWVQAWDGHTRTGNQSYGNAVRLLHAPWRGGQLKTLYAHLSSVAVRSGQEVAEGQLIGNTGNTGNSYGAHLHYEVWWSGKRTNPLVWHDADYLLASDDIYTYGPGEHAVTVPDEAAEPPAAPAAQLQHVRVACTDPEDGAQIGSLLATLQVPLEATVSNGDAYSIMRAAQTLGAEYTSEYVEG